jgi:hypothetical protein
MLEDSLAPTLETIDRLGEKLRDHERKGDLRAAKRLLRSLIRYDAAVVGAAAGHTVRWADHLAFWKDLMPQVAEACSRRCDGYALRGVAGPVRNLPPTTDTAPQGALP